MAYDTHEISLLNKVEITTKEVVVYLEKINQTNNAIIDVLKRKPALPDYEKLSWFLSCKVDEQITNKLKVGLNLNTEEKSRLKSILTEAARDLRKFKHMFGQDRYVSGLEKYLKQVG